MKMLKVTIPFFLFIFCVNRVDAQTNNLNKRFIQLGIDGFSDAQSNRSYLFRGLNNPTKDSSSNYRDVYNITASIGRFKTNYSSVIWTFGLNISKIDGDNNRVSSSSSLGLSVKRTNEYYKNVLGKIGVYGNFNMQINYSKETENYTKPTYSNNLSNFTNRIGLGITSGAGLYYSFTERWTLTANLISVDGLYLRYNWFNSQRDMPISVDSYQTVSDFEYEFFPRTNLTNGLNLRYIF